jgi:Fe-S-cluster-containing hydrogenase component 2
MRIKFHNDRCTECGKCILACKESHEDGVARLAIERRDDGLKLRQCVRCTKPQCAYACTYELIYRDKELRTLKIITEECQACHACYKACPFDAIFINPENDIPVICDLCDGNPQCVLACPEDALQLKVD